MPYKRDYILHRRSIILRSLLIVSTPYLYTYPLWTQSPEAHMGWLRLVGSLKLYVSFAKEPYKRDYILQKRPRILRSLLIEATPHTHTYILAFALAFAPAKGEVMDELSALIAVLGLSHTHTHTTDVHRDRHTDTHTHTRTQRTQTHRHAHRLIHRNADTHDTTRMHTHTHTEKETDRDTDIQTRTHDTCTYIDTHTHTHTHRCTWIHTFAHHKVINGL